MVAIATCLALCASGVSAEESNETTRYHELARSEAAFASAVAAHVRGEFGQAERGYLDAIEGDAGFVEAMVNLARVHIQRRELTKAAIWLDRAERRRPEYPGIAAARGLMALESGDLALAIDELTAARSRIPRDVEVLMNLAAALIMNGTNQEAIEVLDEAQRLDPHRADASFNLGLAHDQIGDTPRATHHYQRYLRLARVSDPQREGVLERIEVLKAAGVPEPGPVAIKLKSSSPATSKRTVATGGVER